jgi:DNA-binding CsgD family transcriptional regulator
MSVTRAPFVGRSDELGVMRSLVASVRAGSGGCLVVVGVAGSGKSSLVARAASLAADAGVAHRTATASSGVQAPFNLVRSSFEMLDPVTPAPDTPRSFFEAGAGVTASLSYVEQVVDLVERKVATEPTLLVLDDVHLADPASLAVIGGLLPWLDSLPLGIVLACREPERTNSLASWWPALEQSATVLRLQTLDDDEIAEWCAERLGGRPGPRLVQALAATGGVPLLIATVLDAASDELLVRERDEIDIDTEAADGLRASVPDPVRARVRSVVGDDSFIAAAGALAGGSFGLADVAAVTETSLAVVAEVVDRFDTGGIVVAEGITYRYRHEFYRLAAVDLVSEPIRAAVHRRFATLMSARGEAPLAIADHVLAAGATGTAAAHVLTQAASMLVDHDPSTSLDLCERAVAIVDRPDRALTMVRMRALSSAGRVAESMTLGRSLLDGASPADEVAVRRDLAIGLFQLGRPGESIAEFRRAEQLASTPSQRNRLSAERAFMHLLAGEFSEAGEVSGTAAHAAAAAGDVVSQLGAEFVHGLITLYLFDLDAAEAIADRLVRLADLPEALHARLYQPWFAATLIRIELGDLAAARTIAAAGRQRAQSSGYLWVVPGYDTLDACAALTAGDFDEAETLANAALASGIADAYGASLWCEAMLARIAVSRGEWKQAHVHIAAADGHLRAGQAQFGYDHLAIATAAVMEHDGEVEGAFELLTGYWDAFDAWAIDSPRQELSLDVVRLAVAVGDRGRADLVRAHLAATAERAARRRFALDSRLATAYVNDDREEASVVATEFRSLGIGLRARRADVFASGSIGPLVDDMGGTTPGTSAGRLARSLDRLTPSQRSVVELVAAGLSNGQIAERLVVSRRTVESHVSSAYRSLGVTNRVELARVVLGD